MTTHVIVDSCSDLNLEVLKLLGVTTIDFSYVVGGTEHKGTFANHREAHKFYDAMRKGTYPTTAALSPGDYYEAFRDVAKHTDSAVFLSFTEGLSSSIHAAQQASQLLANEYPDFELYIIDNLCPSLSAGLLAMETVEQAKNGLSARDLAEWVREARYFVHGVFTLDSFDALAKGGRMPAAAATIGSKLDIKPELTYDTRGALKLKRMCRGKKKAFRAMIEDFKTRSAGERSMPLAIATADAEHDGDILEALIRREEGCEDLPIVRSMVDPTIGTHVGPGMVALAFWGSDRREKNSLPARISSLAERRA